MTFRVRRSETIHYWIDYDREQVLDLLSLVYGEVDPAIREEFDEMNDDHLAIELGQELRGGSEATDRVIEESERYADVAGSDFEVYALTAEES
jgi:hypothetical protein